MMCFNKDDQTALDVAGSHLSNEASIVILTFFEKNFNIIEKVFLGNRLQRNKI